MRSKPQETVFLTAYFLILAIGCEVGCYILLWAMQPYLDEPIRTKTDIYREQTMMLQEMLSADGSERDLFDPELGWRYRPGFASDYDRLNKMGLRGSREYPERKKSGALRFAAFGDSFVYGTEVGFQDAWPRLIEDAYPSIEVLNYGVGGYGTDQSLLRYRQEGSFMEPDGVLIGFAPINIVRNVNRYRRFFSTKEWTWVKPRFLLSESGTLDYLPNPIQDIEDWRPYLKNPSAIREFGDQDFHYEPLIYENPLYDWSALARVGAAILIRARARFFGPERIVAAGKYNQSSPAFPLQRALIKAFAAEAAANGAIAIVVVLPAKTDVRNARLGTPTLYSSLLKVLENIKVIDLAEAFVAGEPPEGDMENWFMSGGHYSPAGNTVVAAWLGERLNQYHSDRLD